MPKISISYVHPTLGPTQIKNAQEVHVNVVADSGVSVIAYRSAKGEHITLTTNVPFVVREGEDAVEPVDPEVADARNHHEPYPDWSWLRRPARTV